MAPDQMFLYECMFKLIISKEPNKFIFSLVMSGPLQMEAATTGPPLVEYILI